MAACVTSDAQRRTTVARSFTLFSMLSIASLLAAMTIAGAFWVGVLAARRLRDWGDERRALDESTPQLALAAASVPPDDARTRKVRNLVAQRIDDSRYRALFRSPEDAGDPVQRRTEDISPTNLRLGDVVVIESAEAIADGDYLTEGVVLLREGGSSTVVVVMADGSRRRWLVAPVDAQEWIIVEPVTDHGLSGEPPRNLRRARGEFGLRRRGQASAAATGRHERPELPRVATYVFRGLGRDVLWVERWGHEILMGEGRLIDRHSVSFLPGS